MEIIKFLHIPLLEHLLLLLRLQVPQIPLNILSLLAVAVERNNTAVAVEGVAQ
jgi:hypothetical protein